MDIALAGSLSAKMAAEMAEEEQIKDDVDICPDGI
jgi:hypothetical protein